MRILVLIVLIAVFPLRGFASVGMQTGMGTAALHHAMVQADAETGSSGVASATDPMAEQVCTCCAQCSVCDLCHLLLGQTPAPLLAIAVLETPLPAPAPFRFASADRRVAHKPPLSLL